MIYIALTTSKELVWPIHKIPGRLAKCSQPDGSQKGFLYYVWPNPADGDREEFKLAYVI
jgi:hypothetical protein